MIDDKSSCTCIAPINIAIVKYWGKADAERMLPCNPSLSVTLSAEQLYTSTKISISKGSGNIRFVLNGHEQENDRRLNNLIKQFSLDGSNTDISIESINSFPTAAGLASSASGFAALALGLDRVYRAGCSLERLSEIARMGSGSACRSVFGGFVIWEGSYARQLLPASHWPELKCIVCIIDGQKKTASSREGMQRTTRTSALFKERLNNVPERMDGLIAAIETKDFEAFADIAMKESNQLHAICLDTFPPIRYLNDQSFRIIDKVHELNSTYGCIAAYTFDAGPNAFVFCLEHNLGVLQETLSGICNNSNILCSIGDGPVTSSIY